MSRPPLDPDAFSIPADAVWALHCADGPSPIAAAEAAAAWLDHELKPWTLRIDRDFEALPASVRAAGARVLGAQPSDVGLTATTSSGLVAIAQGFPWPEGRSDVVLPRGEFPSNVWPWRALAARGVQITEVPLWPGHQAGAMALESSPPTADDDPEDRLLDALDRTPTARLLSVSWVRFQDGLVLDLGRLADGCRARGVDLVVDGIQGAGTLPLDAEALAKRGLGAFATGGHKGLLGVHGSGLLWTASSLRRRLLPTGSWLSVADGYDFSRPNTDLDRPWLDDGRRLEQGTPNLVGCVLFGRSLALLADVGIERLAEHIATLRRRLLAGLAETSLWSEEARRLLGLDRVGRLGSIVALHHGALAGGPRALEAVARAGRRRNLYTSLREGYLRIALHGYHTTDDVDRLIDWLATASQAATAQAPGEAV